MKITKIKVKNFKSFKNLNINLKELNVIVGANASGKSNFINIFRFVNDIITYGLDDAISLQGGIKYLYNANIKNNKCVDIYFEVDLSKELKNDYIKHQYLAEGYIPNNFSYEISIKPNGVRETYKVSHEKLNINLEKVKIKKKSKETPNSFCLTISKDGKGVINSNISDLGIKETELPFPIKYFENILKSRMPESQLISIFNFYFFRFRINEESIKIYDFDVNKLKSPSSIIAKGNLTEDGSNLVNIIQKLLKQKYNREKLTKLIKMILPFVEDIKVENNVNRSLYFKMKEQYTDKEFPSNLLSDGTVNILALLIALYFQEDNEISIFEEPEKNLHPKLMSNIVSLFEEVSVNKQIIVTTHNPYFIREVDKDSIFLISRNKNGYSEITKPINSKLVKVFLSNELGMDDLFVNGMLK